MRRREFRQRIGRAVDQSGISILCFEARNGNLGFRVHVADQAIKREQPTKDDFIQALCDDDAKIIEPYPHRPLGRSCLIRGIINSGRVLHLVCGYPPNNWVITTYWPDLTPQEWNPDFSVRVS
jgi:hypothetical protein